MDISSKNLATVLVNEIVSRCGVPKFIHSDQGKNFCSNVIQTLCEILEIHRTQTSGYHPQGNGQTDRFNRTIEAILAKMIQDDQDKWDTHISMALFAYRSAVHESTGFTPFILNFRRSPTLPIIQFFALKQHPIVTLICFLM